MPKSTHQSLVTQRDHGKTLQLFLREELKISSRQAKSMLDSRSVFVNGTRIWMAKHTLRKGDHLEWNSVPLRDRQTPQKIEVLYKDPTLLAVNKPPGMISDRDKHSVENLLREQESSPALRALHRLDKETSGLLMFLRSSEHRENYLDLFRRQEIKKIYQALLTGRPEKTQAVVRKTLDGKTAETQFRVLKKKGDFCKVECQIGTGRLHQIRRHALELNCRVAGDRQYGAQIPLGALEKSLPRQMLHAFSVEFICPQTRKKIRIHAPLADDFQKAVQQMGLS